jgi:4-hydroxy-2-oxoheptanedioate aldolase
MAQTWADVIIYDMEHGPIDFGRFHEFMQGLIEGGPTKSGHRTPAVIPQLGGALDETTMRANYWTIGQCLDLGAHGIHLCHARDPGAVRVLVEACRFPMNTRGMDAGLGEGLRGSGGQSISSTVWGVSQDQYLKRADPWPLNPDGELLIGIKIEDKYALANTEKNVRIPGLGFAEWGPGDMSMSLGLTEVRRSNPPQMVQARARVFAACKANKVNFLAAESADMGKDIAKMIQECRDAGIVLVGAVGEAEAEKGRRLTRRTMPW